MFPAHIALAATAPEVTPSFRGAWQDMMDKECHQHALWQEAFAKTLADGDPSIAFQLAAVWSVNMVHGSYCFPRYVAALAARAEADVLRHGLLENAWDESGSYGHTGRSHFWLAVKLARLLGLTDGEIERIQPLPEAQAYTNAHYRECATGDSWFALGMICLIEEFTTPEFTLIFKSFLRTCRQGMGLEPDDFVLKGGAEYFTANIADDERHREEMPRLVAVRLNLSGVDLDSPSAISQGLSEVRRGVRQSANLRQEFFAGIHRFVRSGGTFRDLR